MPPPEKVQQLISLLDDPDVRAWLAAKSPAGSGSEATAAEQIAGGEEAVRAHVASMRAAFSQLPSEFAQAVRVVKTDINAYGFATIIGLFAVLLAIGFGAEWLFRRAMSAARLKQTKNPAERSHVLHIFAELAPVAVFTLVSAGVFLLFDWPPLLRTIIVTYLLAVVVIRFVSATCRLLLAPDGNDALRLIDVDDSRARFWCGRFTVFISYLMIGWATVSLLPKLGFSPAGALLVTYLIGIGLLALGIEMVWRRPREASARSRLNTVDWGLTIYLVLLWGLWVTGLNLAMWLGIYALLLPKALAMVGQAAKVLATRQGVPASAHSVRTVLIVRGARMLVLLLAVLWFAAVLRVHPGALAGDPLVNRIMRGALRGAVILLAADLLWNLLKAYIDRMLEAAPGSDTVSAAEVARRGRLRTLLPILRIALAIVIATVAVLMVLAELGVQIGPLIAGAGIFGVAIGFGSQTLVKDIVSGIFYMMDDAFRVGEYIQSGSYKGTVESFSLRSVRLRHHRGPVFTVPFGQLGAVENMSRDWVIEKFRIRVPFDTDIKKVKKLVKGIGAELLEDADIAPAIIETVKLKGVEAFGDFGMELSFAFMAKPGQQTMVKRRAQTMIRDAFMANGIEFAQPTVQVGGGGEAATASAAATASHLAAVKAAAPAAG
ncbi:MAG TPA: mechanosensitive ion channel family protein [Rhizobiaceae bacterium]|nr:mechanosensitive ion channel family protein [Rhizobiaceae bacterium]